MSMKSDAAINLIIDLGSALRDLVTEKSERCSKCSDMRHTIVSHEASISEMEQIIDEMTARENERQERNLS